MKRFIFILFLVLFSSRLDAVPVTGTIAPLATNSNYSATDTVYGKGGVWTGLADTTWLTNVNRYPLVRRQAGQLAILTNGAIYQLQGDLSTWTLSTPISALDGSGTNTFLNAPIITNLAGFSLTDSAYYSFGTRNTVGLFTFGDSITHGSSATDVTNQWTYIFANTLGLLRTNLAYAGGMIPDVGWQIHAGYIITNNVVYYSPEEITEDSNTAIMVGFNDNRQSGTSAAEYRLGIDYAIHYLGIPDTYKKFAQAPDSSTGVWTPLPWLGNGNIGASSSTGTLTFSNVIGSEVYIGYIGWATNGYGTISVSVDGVAETPIVTANAAYGNRAYIYGEPLIPDNVGPYGTGELDFCPQLLSVQGLDYRAHTVVVTASVNPTYVLWVAGNGFPRTLKTGPNVFIGTMPRQSPWTSPGSDTLMGQFNSQMVNSAQAARAAGLRVVIAPVSAYYDPATGQSGDGVHPNDVGHAAIANGFLANSSMDLTTFGGLNIQSGAASSSGVFSTLSVSGVSTLSGNATINARLLVLPTASAGGTQSRFGFGTVAASTFTFTHSATGLDRWMDFTGNSIAVKRTSDSTVQNMSLGSAGANVNFPGTATITGTLGVSGITTLDERLLVLTTPASGGSLSRFAIGGSTNSSVAITAGDTALDRTLFLTGNAIYVAKSSDSTLQNLSLGSIAHTTAIGGSATVAEGLTVTGVGTVNSNLVVAVAMAASSGTQSGSSKTVTVNQSGTAASDGDLVAITETAIGSGGNNIYRGTVGGTNRYRVLDVGRVILTAATSSDTTLNGDTSGASSFVFRHGDTALDRKTTFTGNSIQTTLSSAGTAQNLSLQPSGAGIVVGSSGTAVTRLKHGRATLAAGAVNVTETTVTASSHILLTHATAGSGTNVLGLLYVGTRTNAASFFINSTSGTDDSVVDWALFEP